ncbi:MAG: amidase [Blastocatellia bacterium]|nr:MAG: amidase [Blastocatellia bacterium]
MSELTSLTLTEMAQLIAARKLSRVDLIRAHLELIEKLNPSLNAIVTLNPDALDQARTAEANTSSELPPLHGVPLTIKDTIETAGLRSTSGSVLRRDFVPLRDAPAVARLKSAGAILLGKTNAAEMAMDYTADNPVFGRTNNPFDSSLTPGGSSGGEAVAIATKMSPGGLGSDLAGSIRIPAHFCGIPGLKPTTGRVPGDGQFPPSSGPYSLGAVIGPMARSIADLRLLFHVLANTSVGPPTKLRRAAWYVDDSVAPVTEETAKAIQTAAAALQDAGYVVAQTRPPHVERANELWLRVFSRASVVQLRQAYKGRENEGGGFVSWRLKTADDTPPPTLDEYIASWIERDRLRAELIDWMSMTPILVCPVGATPAYKHDTLKVTVGDVTMGTFRAFSYAQAFNVFDLPAVTLPAGRSKEGLPIGVQIAGLPFAEESVLAAAEVVEEAVSFVR